jgi:hypothetical protein
MLYLNISSRYILIIFLGMPQLLYVEDSSITIPVLKDGVTRLGDLWNCHDSKFVGANLFNQYLDGVYVSASPIESLEYLLIYSKSASDKYKPLNIGGEVSIELLAGLIKVKGSVDYNSCNDDSCKIEQIICNYSRETFSVYVQSNAEKLIDEVVARKLINKEIDATHFVRGIVLGAEVKADIILSRNKTNEKNDLKSDILGNCVFGPINPLVKAKLTYLDSEGCENYKKVINVHSMPSMIIEPKTIAEMFDSIENIESQVNQHKLFPLCNEMIVGVPIRFILVPIKHLLEIDIEKLFSKISENDIRELEDMFIRVQDIQAPFNISKKIIESNPNLAIILDDPKSKFSIKIHDLERRLQEIGQRYFKELVEIFKKYKNGLKSIDDISDLRRRFENECNSCEILEQISNFINEGEGKNFLS